MSLDLQSRAGESQMADIAFKGMAWVGAQRLPGWRQPQEVVEMFPFRPDVAYQQAFPQLGESTAIVDSEQTSRACGTPVAAPRQPVPPGMSTA